jgi:hypothetical protein
MRQHTLGLVTGLSILLASSYMGTSSAEESSIFRLQPRLTVGSKEDIPISSSAQYVLNGSASGIKFSPAVPPKEVPVSAEVALALADKLTLSSLTQPPLRVTVDYLTYDKPTEKVKGKPVWRVIYWGSPMYLGAPPPVFKDGKVIPPDPKNLKQPTSRKAVTYVLIDPFNPQNDFIEQGSAGAISD